MLRQKSCLLLPATLLKTELFRWYFPRINENFSGKIILSGTSEFLFLDLYLLLLVACLWKAWNVLFALVLKLLKIQYHLWTKTLKDTLKNFTKDELHQYSSRISPTSVVQLHYIELSFFLYFPERCFCFRINYKQFRYLHKKDISVMKNVCLGL